MLIAESSKSIPDIEDVPGHKGLELSRTPVQLKSGDWVLKVVPWIGGRIISMEHGPSGFTSFSIFINHQLFNSTFSVFAFSFSFQLLKDVNPSFLYFGSFVPHNGHYLFACFQKLLNKMARS